MAIVFGTSLLRGILSEGGPVNGVGWLLFFGEVDPAVGDKSPWAVNVAHINIAQADQPFQVVIA
jgi:hypothetical protein